MSRYVCSTCIGQGVVTVVKKNSSGQKLSSERKACPECKGTGYASK